LWSVQFLKTYFLKYTNIVLKSETLVFEPKIVYIRAYMPRAVNQGFLDFHDNLTPTPGESEAAKNHRATIKACLENNFGMLRFFAQDHLAMAPALRVTVTLIILQAFRL
jgi:hypothetical protein